VWRSCGRNFPMSASRWTRVAAVSSWNPSSECIGLTWVLAQCGPLRNSNRNCWLWGSCIRKPRPLLLTMQMMTSKTKMYFWTQMTHGWQIHRHRLNHHGSFLHMCKTCTLTLIVAVICIRPFHAEEARWDVAILILSQTLPPWKGWHSMTGLTPLLWCILMLCMCQFIINNLWAQTSYGVTFCFILPSVLWPCVLGDNTDVKDLHLWHWPNLELWK